MKRGRIPVPRARSGTRVGLALAAVMAASAGALEAQCTTANTIAADVVAIDQFIWYNRLGAHAPDGLMYVLEQDLVNSTGGLPASRTSHKLRPGKRPRPLVLRVNAGQCLQVNFKNWLSSAGGLGTTAASVHVTGMQVVRTIDDDGSNVGKNINSALVEPGNSRTYVLYAEREGTYFMYSTAQTTGGEGDGGQIGKGLFGAVNVQPAGAEYYRSQVTAADLAAATTTSTADGFPVINYDATYASGPLAGRPILKMVQNGKLMHGDLSAIITGPNRGNFQAGVAYPNDLVQASPDRLRPFREYTVIFHDEAGLRQAFEPIFEADSLQFTLQGGRDAFGINYGTGGIGAEVLANRFGLGPMANCNECKMEEFFLSSWAVGDPAMVVDNPAGAAFNPANPTAQPKATVAYFPDDPSNVFHSYLNDHVKIRNLHAGPKEHHVFHLHAHQWLHTPNSPNSNYHDSQAIGPGAGFTYEITYGGSGNRNQTIGDAILHCHFYPHFAQGMWALWRVHDVLEKGTQIDPATQRPVAGARALPDGEITTGTPIPAIVPMPTYAMAPLPTANMKGFPFYIPGVAGHRPPKPPLDTQPDGTLATGYRDGGLPRHVVTGGTASFLGPNTRDFHKHDLTLSVKWLSETGTPEEQAAMAFHATAAGFSTPVAGNTGIRQTFKVNGKAGVAGAPYADPCPASPTMRTYKGAAFQLTAQYNKAGWFFNQHRMFGLWSDVNAFIAGTKAPEPFFFRAHDNDCIQYHLVNLIPEEYKQDDFQVTTPTDVIGQHIHLVKFDVTSSDGAANGWNYEDGSLSPGDVQHRVKAIRLQNGCAATTVSQACPKAVAHPFFGAGADTNGDGVGDWVGAQETIQRWWVDPIPRSTGTSRLGTIFTHDHFGPSTHQQAGLYAGLLPEDRGTTWRDPETGGFLSDGSRTDGGPTSWRADILYPGASSKNFREFGLQIADFALAYGKEGLAGSTVPRAINPPGKFEVGLPFLQRPPAAGSCPNGTPAPCPEIISLDDPGTMLVNYRNEPLAMRVRTPGSNSQAIGRAGDLSKGFSSRITHDDTRFNTYGPYGARPGERPADPFTPLLRAYEHDKINVRLLVGAHEEGHNFAINGTRWKFEPLDINSGWRNSQMVGISEYTEMNLDPLFANQQDTLADYLYVGGGATDDLWNGAWGIVRAYRKRQNNLQPLRPFWTLSTDPWERSFSLWAILRDIQAGRKALPDGYLPEFPDPQNPATWEGDITRAYNQTVYKTQLETNPEQEVTYTNMKSGYQLESSQMQGGGVSGVAESGDGTTTTMSATTADSISGGYGSLSTGGIEYRDFEYDPESGTEYVATSDTAAAKQENLQYNSVETTELQQEETATRQQYATLQESQMAAAGSSGTVVYSGSGGTNRGFWGICPRVAPIRYYDITAVSASNATLDGRITYNARAKNGGPLVDPAGIMYVFTSDLDAYGKIRAGTPMEPIVLRANAGDCIMVRLSNRVQTPLADPDGFNTLPIIVDKFNNNQIDPSASVGLHPQLVAYDVTRSDGSMVGFNDSTIVAPNRYRWYQWYAGDVSADEPRRRLISRGIEFGATNLIPADRVKHSGKGAIGALIIEPVGSRHYDDAGTRASARIVKRDGTWFREFVVQYQDDLNLRFGAGVTLKRFDCQEIEPGSEEYSSCSSANPGYVTYAAGSAVPNTAEAEDPEDSGQKAFNYRTEPLWFRYPFAPDAELEYTEGLNFRNILKGDSAQTPLFKANAGDQVRVRVLQPGGHARNHVFALHGHVWEELPYVPGTDSILGANKLSEWKGARDGMGPTNHFDLLPRNGAGGKFRIPGDYLYRDMPSFQFDGGLWGIFRVLPAGGTTTTTTSPTTTTTSPTPTSPTSPTTSPTSPTYSEPTTSPTMQQREATMLESSAQSGGTTGTTTEPSSTTTTTTTQPAQNNCVIDPKTGKTKCS